MEIVTTWMERGIEQGLARGLKQGRQEGRQEAAARESKIFLQHLKQRLGQDNPDFNANEIRLLSLEQIESFGRQLLEYEAIADVLEWLYSLDSVNRQQERCIHLLEQQLGSLPSTTIQQLQTLELEQWKAIRKQLANHQLTLTSIEDLQQFLTELDSLTSSDPDDQP